MRHSGCAAVLLLSALLPRAAWANGGACALLADGTPALAFARLARDARTQTASTGEFTVTKCALAWQRRGD